MFAASRESGETRDGHQHQEQVSHHHTFMPAPSAFVMDHVFSNENSRADQDPGHISSSRSNKRFKSWDEEENHNHDNNTSGSDQPDFATTNTTDSPDDRSPPLLTPPPHDPLSLEHHSNHHNEEEAAPAAAHVEPDDEDDDDDVAHVVAEVTEEMLLRLDNEEWDHVNGLYDGQSEWRTWDQTVSFPNDFDQSTFIILPYIDIDSDIT